MADHFRAYQAATGSATWATVIDKTYSLISTMEANYASSTYLVPDFVVKTNTASPAPASSNYLEDTTDGQYAYNACRVPWRVGTDYLVHGELRAKTIVDGMTTWIRTKTGSDPSKILDGYTLVGGTGAQASGENFAFTGPFGVAAMASASNQAWLDAIWKHMVTDMTDPNADEAYFGNTVKLLTMLVMSNNWLAP